MPLTKLEHLDSATQPKRILSLDGGGLRGVVSLEYLTLIEALLKQRSGREDFRLRDYFDLIGGTSTGAIIAAALACGMEVAQIKQLYRELGRSVFRKSFLRKGVLAAKFPSDRVQEALEHYLGKDVTLNDDRIQTGLMVMTKRLDTGSPWPLHNHPEAPYASQDGKLLLSHIVRASTAAPTYFEPERISIESRGGAVTEGAFIDGGMTPFNDPALQMLMLACLQGHGFRWKPGTSHLLLVSIGTGTLRASFDTECLMNMVAAKQALCSLQSLMYDCSRMNQMLLQWLTHGLTPWQIDRAVGDLHLDSQGGPALASYVRYDVPLEVQWLKRELGAVYDTKQLAALSAMDEPNNLEELAALGANAAKMQVNSAHFPMLFDV